MSVSPTHDDLPAWGCSHLPWGYSSTLMTSANHQTRRHGQRAKALAGDCSAQCTGALFRWQAGPRRHSLGAKTCRAEPGKYTWRAPSKKKVHMAGSASQLESPLGGGRGPGEEVSSTSALRERADPICVKFLEYLGRRIFSVVAGEEEHSVPFGAGRACCGFNF